MVFCLAKWTKMSGVSFEKSLRFSKYSPESISSVLPSGRRRRTSKSLEHRPAWTWAPAIWKIMINHNNLET